MSSLITMSIDLKQIDKAKLRNGQYLDITLSVSDESKKFGNVSTSYNQTKDERDAKAPKEYLKGCFSKVIWTDGSINKWVEPTETKIQEQEDDLFF